MKHMLILDLFLIIWDFQMLNKKKSFKKLKIHYFGKKKQYKQHKKLLNEYMH